MVWYQLVDADGDPYKGADVSVLPISRDSMVAYLRIAVHDACKITLANVDPIHLKVYASREDIMNLNLLRRSLTVANLPLTTEDTPLYIVVSPYTLLTSDDIDDVDDISAEYQQAIVESQPPLPQLPPINPERLKRWGLLNEISGAKYRKITDIQTTNGALSSELTWDDVKHVYDPITVTYALQSKPIPQETLDTLYEYLTQAGNVFHLVSNENEKTRLHFIAPIVFHVATLFDDVKVLADETLNGKNIDVNVRFEFILQRGQKRICVVQAKRKDELQGEATGFLGCEVVADLKCQSCVYSIVTDYTHWIFLKSLDNRIEKHTAILTDECDSTLSKASLAQIAGFTNAMLSE
jgi:hypothetical protein